MKRLSDDWAPMFRASPEVGMGLHSGSVTLKNGRHYEHVLFDSGFISRVSGHSAVPFEPDEIASIKLTTERWDWKE